MKLGEDKNTYQSIQYLRAIAAIIVVVLHLHTGNLFPMNFWVSWMYSGVDIFFVISGFIMVRSTHNKDIFTQHFYFRRLIRIVPLYWLLTLATIMGDHSGPKEILYSFLFIPYLDTDLNMYLPLLFVGWTLNLEIFFYFLFGLLLRVPEKRRIALISTILTLLVTVGSIFTLPGIINFYTNPIILEFALGMMIATLKIRVPPVVIPIAIGLLVCLHNIIDFRLVHFGMPAAVLVAGFVNIEHRMPHVAILKLLGDASYALYLSHLLVLMPTLAIWQTFFFLNYFFLPIALVATFCIAILIHLGFEKPAMNILTHWLVVRNHKINRPLAGGV